MVAISTLRPGYLVSCKTTVKGNVHYSHKDVEAEHVTVDGEQRAVWETEKTVTDPAEHENAIKTRSKAIALIRGVCARSAFGLLCPENKRDQLDKAVDEANRIVAEFNATASLSQISVFVIAGKVDPNEVGAIRALNSEVTDLLQTMEDAIRGINLADRKSRDESAAAIRDAANRAKSVSAMLNDEAQARAQAAIDAGRRIARAVSKEGEAEIDQASVRQIAEARFAFLDFEPAAEVTAPEIAGRDVDFEPLTSITVAAAPAAALEL